MLTEAVGLAVLAALSPTAVLVSAVFLSSANPHRTVLIYLAGAIVMTVIFAAVIFVAMWLIACDQGGSPSAGPTPSATPTSTCSGCGPGPTPRKW